MNNESLDHQHNESKPTSKRFLKVALAGVVAAGVLATSGVAHAGYRWGRMAPPTTVEVKNPVAPSTVTPTTAAQKITTTTAPVAVEGYRWR